MLNSLKNIIFFFLLCIISNYSCKSTQPTITESSKTENIPSLELEENAHYELVKSIPIKGSLMTTDKLQNSYVVSDNNELIKYNKEGKSIYTYSNFDLGEITHIDATNPFSILVYYSQFQTIVILDRTLNALNIIDLFKTNAPIIKAVGIADDQNVWIYDETNFKLKKIDASGIVVFESNDLSLTLEKTIPADFLLESEGFVYLSEKNGDVLIFDIFSNYIRTEPFNIENGRLQTFDDLYVYLRKDGIHIVNPLLGKEDESILVLPKNVKNVVAAEIQQNRLFLLQKESLNIYTFEKKSE